jgi:hypothetical protein
MINTATHSASRLAGTGVPAEVTDRNMDSFGYADDRMDDLLMRMKM